jgi:hypothetical protein
LELLELIAIDISGVVASALAGVGVGFFGCLLSSADKQRSFCCDSLVFHANVQLNLENSGNTLRL